MKITELLNAQPTQGLEAHGKDDPPMMMTRGIELPAPEGLPRLASMLKDKLEPPPSAPRLPPLPTALTSARPLVPTGPAIDPFARQRMSHHPNDPVQFPAQPPHTWTSSPLIAARSMLELASRGPPQFVDTGASSSGDETSESAGDPSTLGPESKPIPTTIPTTATNSSSTRSAKRKPHANAKGRGGPTTTGAGVKVPAATSPPMTGHSTTRGRRRTQLVTLQTGEEKRAKQRLLVKRSYYRKIDTLNSLRETVAQLESEYNEVVAAQAQTAAAIDERPVPRHSISAIITRHTPEEELRQSFQKLAVSIEHLRRENEDLRAVAMEQSKAQTRLGILLQEEAKDQVKRSAQYSTLLKDMPPSLRSDDEEMEISDAPTCPTQENVVVDAKLHHSKHSIKMAPITVDECMEVVRDAYAEIMNFRRSTNYVTSGGNVFGWRDRRQVDGDYVKFALEKLFRNRTVHEVAHLSWQVLSSEAGANRIYSSSVRAQFQLIQRVDEHNLIFYRTMERVGQNVVLKSLVLASFVEIENGYLILYRSVDPHKRNVRDASPSNTSQKEMWVEMFSWGVFEPAGPNNEHCTDFFGGPL